MWFMSVRRRLWREHAGVRFDRTIVAQHDIDRATGTGAVGLSWCEPIDLLIAGEAAERAAEGEHRTSIERDGPPGTRTFCDARKLSAARKAKARRAARDVFEELGTS
jgi:hypothetical protein